jgi:protein-S-isoprenylcysteine O-methyltransferase Ste14
MKRIVILIYGVVCYLIFFATFLYAIWFVYTMDQPLSVTRPLLERLCINAALLSIFAVQHSVMARPWFKHAWTKIIPQAAERSTYVLLASLALLLLIQYWQPVLRPIWTVESPAVRAGLHTLFWLGWAIVLATTFLIDHFELFGLKQVWVFFNGGSLEYGVFKTPGPYKVVRHPLYLGFIIAFWSTPDMTAGHLFFAVMTTAYILVAIQFEEHDLVHFYGEQYRNYKKSVSMIVPWPRR